MVKRLIHKGKGDEILFDFGESKVRIEGDGIECGPLVVSRAEATLLWQALIVEEFEALRD